MADALATALFVLGPDSGRALLDGLAGISGVIVTEEPEGLVAYPSNGFLNSAVIDTAQVRLRQASVLQSLEPR